MTLNSRAKGKNGELELSAFLRERGFEARRGQQFKGGADSPDVVGLPGFHLECKRVEAGNPYVWMEQAIREAAAGSTPLVCHRRNRRDWLAILRLEDLIAILPARSEGEQQ
jgi:Holliday junction resolvase